MNTSENQVRHWNATAIAAMVQGDLDKGLELLKAALQLLRTAQQDMRVEYDENASTAVRIGADHSINKKLVGILVSTEDALTSASVFPFFNRALLPPDTASNGVRFEEDSSFALTTSIILFNSGLCHHLKAAKNGKSADLQKALNFYQLAANILFSSYDDEIDNSNAEPLGASFLGEPEELLVLALVNNMGNIHESQMRFQEASVCLEWVKTFFQYMSDVDNSVQAVGNDIFGFYITAFLFPEKITYPAAAA